MFTKHGLEHCAAPPNITSQSERGREMERERFLPIALYIWWNCSNWVIVKVILSQWDLTRSAYTVLWHPTHPHSNKNMEVYKQGVGLVYNELEKNKNSIIIIMYIHINTISNTDTVCSCHWLLVNGTHAVCMAEAGWQMRWIWMLSRLTSIFSLTPSPNPLRFSVRGEGVVYL